jgi:hypothetical protein
MIWTHTSCLPHVRANNGAPGNMLDRPVRDMHSSENPCRRKLNYRWRHA